MATKLASWECLPIICLTIDLGQGTMLQFLQATAGEKSQPRKGQAALVFRLSCFPLDYLSGIDIQVPAKARLSMFENSRVPLILASLLASLPLNYPRPL